MKLVIHKVDAELKSVLHITYDGGEVALCSKDYSYG